MSDGNIIINYEKVRILKETVVACFKVLSRHFLGETEENYESFCKDGR
jgi:hypothetical protein